MEQPRPEYLEEEIEATANALHALADHLDGLVAELRSDEIVCTNIIGQLPVNTNPDHPDLVKRKWKWWPIRAPEDITGVTIHHTLSHSPAATAAYCTRLRTQGGKGYPSIQYHFWVAATDGCPVYLCAPLTDAVWHDHTGAHQTTISIGMAGHLHKVRPPDEQIIRTVELVAWLMKEYNFPLEQVQGHKQRAYEAARIRTVCPGWDSATQWHDDFYNALKVRI